MLNNSQITVGGNAVCQKCEHCRCVSPARIRRGWSAQEKRRKSEATGCCLQLISPPEFQIIIWFSTSRLNKTDRLIKQIEFAQNDFRQPVLVFCMAAWRFAHSGHNKGVPEIFGFFFRFGLVEYVFFGCCWFTPECKWWIPNMAHTRLNTSCACVCWWADTGLRGVFTLHKCDYAHVRRFVWRRMTPKGDWQFLFSFFFSSLTKARRERMWFACSPPEWAFRVN